jgi:hypothetical protein
VEEAQLEAVNWQAERVEGFRTQVTVTAIKAAAAHLGTLREGRKTMILVTEGLGSMPPGLVVGGRAPRNDWVDDQDTALDVVRTANDSNTAVHVLDPRGLQVAAMQGGMLETLAYGSGGELHRANDMSEAVQRIVGQASATYLLGYTRELPLDGRFHAIRVRVKRGGYEVRARAGYWAPKAGDVDRARTAAAAAVLPAPLAAAFASLNPPNSSRLVEIWVGAWPLPDGRSQITVAWTPVPGGSVGGVPASVTVRLTAGGEPPLEGTVPPGGTSFDVPDVGSQLALRVVDKSGETLDRETRSLAPLNGRAVGLGLTAVVRRASTPAEIRTLTAPGAPIHAGREFLRTDRLLI